MQIPAWIQALFRVDDSLLAEQFVLTDEVVEDSNDPSKGNSTTGPSADSGGADAAGKRAAGRDQGSGGESEAGSPARGGQPDARGPRPVRPVAIEDYVQQAQREEDATHQPPEQDDRLPAELTEAKRELSALFHLPANKDVVVREFVVGRRRWPALAVFIDGMADKMVINTHILQPLMFLSEVAEDDAARRMEPITQALLPGNQIELVETWQGVVSGVVAGSTVVFVDGCRQAVVVESKGWEHRSVNLPRTEQVVRGPHNAFTESFRANTGLVRAFLRSERLVTEILSVGRVGKTDVAVMYIEGLTNKSLVDEVKRRIQAIDVDYLADSGILEQFIEDNPGSLIPQVLATERPDRIAHMLSEGHVAILVGQSPYALAVPVVLWTMVQSPEDAFLRFPFGTFGRIIRWVALLAAFLLPAGYVAITNYHSEMIPTDLMLAIAASRERVPFAVIMEVIMMEFAIELIREAGIRIPNAVGPTIGIVGALIIGQAAVEAGLVSPLLVIVVAVTALCSFAIPDYALSYAVRILRFVFLVCAAFFGFYAIALLMCMLMVRLAVMKSFGVPLLSPLTPVTPSTHDVWVRGPVYKMNQRPSYLRTQTQQRQEPITRAWSPFTRKAARRSLFRRRNK
ncbi:spore germination protein [Alicyclobacillus kakegawensis]|uniref:spore germination protein n=1 Tax=Alicyclobacillus kakegawensis TaxID=392012 RepID=UPI00082E328A|nr:spore germination protein [Alicyclobacillus kakegawensis]